MSLVHIGVDAWVVVAVLKAGAEEVVDGTALGEVFEPEEAGDVLGVVDVLRVPDPEVALVHPASATPTTSAHTVSRELRRIIDLSSSGST